MRLADGLIVRRISLGRREVTVVKRPSDEQFFFFELDEWEVLATELSIDRTALASGSQPSTAPRVPPLDADDVEEVKQFLRLAAELGLIVDHPANATPTAILKPSWYANPFVIRAPGFDPNRFLASLVSSLDGFGRSKLKFIALATMLLAAVVAVFNLPTLLDDATQAASRIWASPNQAWLAFVIAVAIVKIGHELAHGLACHWGGGRCREMGLLLLFGVPCLYCDVSDTWLMPKRRHRVLVSAAGMLAELLMASIALLIWSVTYQGFVHDLMSMLVLVASVSTLVVNINPLLRYDGYFILSDWIGVPNLSSEANQALRDRLHGDTENPKQYGLAAYAVASSIYRMFVIGLIAWLASGWLLKWVGVGLAVPVALWIGWNIFRRWIWEEISSVSPRLAIGLGVGVFAFVLWIPLPQSTRVGGLIRPRGERLVYAPTSGMLRVDSDTVEIENWERQLEMTAAEGEAKESQTALRSLEIERLSDPAISISLPLWCQRLKTANEKFDILTSQVKESVITIPSGSQLFEPPWIGASKRSRSQHDDSRTLWTGTPTSSFNSKLVVEKGLVLGRLGDSDERTVSAFVPDRQIDFIRIGAPVTIGIGSYPLGSVHGRVVEVSTDPVDELPTEILSSGWVRPAVSRAESARPENTHYEVTIEVTSSVKLPARLVTPVRIKMPSESLWDRLLRNWRATSTLSI